MADAEEERVDRSDDAGQSPWGPRPATVNQPFSEYFSLLGRSTGTTTLAGLIRLCAVEELGDSLVGRVNLVQRSLREVDLVLGLTREMGETGTGLITGKEEFVVGLVKEIVETGTGLITLCFLEVAEQGEEMCGCRMEI